MPKKSKLLYLLLTVCFPVCASAQYDPNHFDPDNAAHWYRKAFALYEEPNDIDLAGYAQGEIKLTPKIELFLKNQQSVIELITKASQIEHCDWEFDPLETGKYTPNPYISDAKDVLILLLANIHYKDSSLSSFGFDDFGPILRLVSHIDSAEAMNHFLSLAIRSMAYRAIHEMLNRYPNTQLDNLYQAQRLIQHEFALYTISYSDIVEKDIQKTKRILTNYKSYIYSDHFLVKEIGIPAEKLSEDFYKCNLKFYEEYMQEYQSFLDLPYPQACQKINEHTESLRMKAKDYFAEYREQIKKKSEGHLFNVLLEAKSETPDFNGINSPMILAEIPVEFLEKCDFLYTMITGPDSPTTFSIDTRIKTQLNALKTGISLLIQYRKIETIPERLPRSSPKDLFSDKLFLVIKTKDGFKLKCQGEDLSRNEVYEYEFILPKE